MDRFRGVSRARPQILIGVMTVFISFGWATVAEATSDTTVILMNGGSNPSSNFRPFEEQVGIFYRKLHERGVRRFHVFNAGGPKTLRARFDEATAPLDANGGFILEPTELKVPHQTASPENFRKLLGALKNKPPKTLTFMFSGHGERDGLGLWNDQTFTFKELDSWFAQMPGTQIRTIIHACYSGSGVVDPNRSMPVYMGQWQSFLNKYYPRNRCALSIAGPEEYELIGQGAVAIRKVAARNPKWSIQGLKNAYLGDTAPDFESARKRVSDADFLTTTPKSTSDFLVDDIINLSCAGVGRKGPTFDKVMVCRPWSGSQFELTPPEPAEALDGLLGTHPCNPKWRVDLRTMDQELDLLSRVRSELNRVYIDVFNRLQKEVGLKEWYRFVAADAEVGKLRATPGHFDAQGAPVSRKAKEAMSRWRTEVKAYNGSLSKFMADVQKTGQGGFTADAKVTELLRTHLSPEYLKSHAKDFPGLNWYIASPTHSGLEYNPILGMRHFNQVLDKFTIEKQFSRRKLVQESHIEREQLLRGILALPGWEPVRERLREIRDCEKSPLSG